MVLCMLFLFITLCRMSASQNEVVTETVAVVTNMEIIATDVICKTCACADGKVDCNNRDIRSAFHLEDWEGLKQLKPSEVDLSNNPLTTFSQVSELPIRTLNLSNCQLEYIENESFMNLFAELGTLDLSNNKISTSALTKRVFSGKMTISGASLKGFNRMRNMSLAYNDIHSLPQDMFFFMSDLTFLDLSGNPMVYIDQVTMGVMSELTKLTELRLSGCELESLPKGILRRQRRLQILDLSDNRFTTIPEAIGDVTNLIYLNLNKNSIETLEEKSVISNLTQLQELRLSRLSKLQSVSAGALGGLQKLEILYLNYNPRLTTLDPAFLMWTDDHDVERWPLLKELYLNNNNITQINSHLLDRWDQLIRVDFANNPYTCDCNNQWMVEVLVPLITGTATNESANNMICMKPSELRGLSFILLNQQSKTLTCPENESLVYLPIPDAAIILGIMIGIFVTFPLVLILVLLWKKGYFTKCRSNIKKNYDEDENEAF